LLTIGHLAREVEAAALPVPGFWEPSSASIQRGYVGSVQQDRLAERNQPTCPTNDPYCCYVYGGCEDSSKGLDAIEPVSAHQEQSVPFDPIGGTTIGRDLLPPGKGNVLHPSGSRVGIGKEGHKRGEVIGPGHGSNDPIGSGGPIGVGKKHKISASSLPTPRSDDHVGSDPIGISQKQHHHRDSVFKGSESGQLASRD